MMNRLTKGLTVVIISCGLVLGQPTESLGVRSLYKPKYSYAYSYTVNCIRTIGSQYWKDEANLQALIWIARKESSLTPGVVNPSSRCFGLFQIHPVHRDLWMIMKRGGCPIGETKAGCIYIKRRYGTPLKAKAFWLKKGWY